LKGRQKVEWKETKEDEKSGEVKTRREKNKE
jgi:hypothetical protein